ncbi:putative bifunctional diguanylate cyclase/phosphodiesterase [Marinobacterium litorale]|uniref:putative bifunctional diguanylate cyclase/phosphodiesterase n=1 Tax=Marinobacterium litorale TaxID=404770 RepID=UPI000687C60A|nr:EAL domain-containing protein [Marinobacterium litorale]
MNMGVEQLTDQNPVPHRQPSAPKSGAWQVLSVEDDPIYQASLIYALEGMEFEGLPVQVLTAQSAAKAGVILAENPDIAVVLLDVVMEEDDAGLRLINTIRERQGNASLRIILVTGQPGMAPRDDVMARYDIDDYWNKADLATDKLITLVTANLRTWSYITELDRARRGLQMLVDASRAISGQSDLPSFSRLVLEQISQLIGAEQGGIVSAISVDQEPLNNLQVMAASGCFSSLYGETLEQLNEPPIQDDLIKARQSRQHIFRPNQTILYFHNGKISAQEYLTVVKAAEPLSDFHISLLHVFAEQVSSGFANLGLTNRLSELAYRDTLLGAHNRNWLCWELGRLSQAARAELKLIVLDIDQFAEIEVTFGNRFTDQLLKSVHERLWHGLEHTQQLVRIGSDSFAILSDRHQAPTAEPLRCLLAQPFEIDNSKHDITFTTACLDLAETPDAAPSDILRMAECCIDSARQLHRPHLDYEPEFSHNIRQRLLLLQQLRQALNNNQLQIALQPKVRLSDGQVIGFEALARWQLEDGTQVPPSEFIPLAEAAGLIKELDANILRQTCRAVRQLSESGFNLPIAFNASGNELFQEEYFSELQTLIEEEQVPPSLLELEITETQAMESYEQIETQLRGLIQMGMGVSIDDFGTGYSSLAHITNLAATTLKIDQSFVRKLGQSSDADHAVEMILRISARFGFNTVAEGIETEEQHQRLRDKGCPVGQGYLFAKPQPLSATLAMLKQGLNLPQ